MALKFSPLIFLSLASLCAGSVLAAPEHEYRVYRKSIRVSLGQEEWLKVRCPRLLASLTMSKDIDKEFNFNKLSKHLKHVGQLNMQETRSAGKFPFVASLRPKALWMHPYALKSEPEWKKLSQHNKFLKRLDIEPGMNFSIFINGEGKNRHVGNVGVFAYSLGKLRNLEVVSVTTGSEYHYSVPEAVRAYHSIVRHLQTLACLKELKVTLLGKEKKDIVNFFYILKKFDALKRLELRVWESPSQALPEEEFIPWANNLSHISLPGVSYSSLQEPFMASLVKIFGNVPHKSSSLNVSVKEMDTLLKTEFFTNKYAPYLNDLELINRDDLNFLTSILSFKNDKIFQNLRRFKIWKITGNSRPDVDENLKYLLKQIAWRNLEHFECVECPAGVIELILDKADHLQRLSLDECGVSKELFACLGNKKDLKELKVTLPNQNEYMFFEPFAFCSETKFECLDLNFEKVSYDKILDRLSKSSFAPLLRLLTLKRFNNEAEGLPSSWNKEKIQTNFPRLNTLIIEAGEEEKEVSYFVRQ